MQRFLLLYISLIIVALSGRADSYAAEVWDDAFYTHPVAEDVHTLRLTVDGDFRKLPVIDNTQNSRLQISFDIIADEQTYLQYQIVHCDAQWRQDDLSELDYVDGFQPNRVTEVTPSFNTYVNYWHYCLSFPNEDAQLLISGNYAVIFHVEGEPDEVVAIACFCVSEQMAFVGGEVSGNTDIDYRQTHQQLTLQCSWSQSQLPYLNPASDLRLVVTQNHRPDTRRDILAPTRIETGKAYYEHLRPLIFEAGNTFRRFEFIDRHYATLGVEQVRFSDPYYEVKLPVQHSRNGAFYLYDQDHHGRYLVHALRIDDVATEAEYFWADISLAGAMAPRGGAAIYLTGDFTYGELLPAWRMDYNPDTQCFSTRVLLKQGHYNYQFICGSEWTPAETAPSLSDGLVQAPSLGPVEGNYYEAHNQYDVYVYYRAPGQRYDRLLGVAQISM